VSLAAVATGAVVCAISGVPASLWIRNLVAWAVGGLVAVCISMTLRPGGLALALGAAPVGLLATFLGQGQLGVHRWIGLGPLYVNAAMLLLPSAIVALAALGGTRRWPWIAAIGCLGLLVVQPDASQASALAAATALVTGLIVRGRIPRLALMIGAGVLAGIAWLRPDPLQPVPEVEGVIGLALALSPITAGLALLLLFAFAATPALATRASSPGPRSAGLALSLCLALWAATPFIGAFPVPLVGIGLSPILGAWLGVGLLAGLVRLDPGLPA
jgi:hypothetical protein